jgi:positive regulator of sigma E activity
MKENLLFANTCGKIYHDSATFAFERKEKTVLIEELEKVKIEIGIVPKSFIMVLFPLSLLSLIYIIRDITPLIKTLIIFFTVLLSAVSLYNAERTFHIVLIMKDGSRLKIRVAENNRKDAEKFTESLKTKLERN